MSIFTGGKVQEIRITVWAISFPFDMLRDALLYGLGLVGEPG